MRFLTLGAVVLATAVSAFASSSAPANAQEQETYRSAFDSNGPMRQGSLCKQRVQPGTPDYFAFPGACEQKAAATTGRSAQAAVEERVGYQPGFEPNGPMRQGNTCKQRVQSGVPDYFSFPGPCEEKTASRRR